jgi:hypothetical protein
MLDSGGALKEQFYTWERRGRGWGVAPYPTVLEPPFRPFVGHYMTPSGPWEKRRRSRNASALEYEENVQRDHSIGAWSHERLRSPALEGQRAAKRDRIACLRGAAEDRNRINTVE